MLVSEWFWDSLRSQVINIMVLFITHATADDEVVTKLRDQLVTADIKCWVDHFDLSPTVDYREALHRAISTCDKGLLVLSRNSASRPEVTSEWNYLLAVRSCPFYVAKIDDIPLMDVNPRLSIVQAIDLHKNWDEGIQQLIEVLHNDKLLQSLTEIMPGGAGRVFPVSKIQNRNRMRMLDNVERFWIKDVLNQSLFRAVRLQLGLKPVPDAVSNPWNTVIHHHSHEDQIVETSTKLSDLFDELGNQILILGDPGSGKTTTLLSLTQELIAKAREDTQYPIPVVFNLSSWPLEHKPIKSWLTEELNLKYQVPRKVAKEWLENDALILLLDGLDEVGIHDRKACVDNINAFRMEHGFVPVVVCSRLAEYSSLSQKLALQSAIVIQPLELDQINQYLDSLGPEVEHLGEAIASNPKLMELARSPLMLSVMVMAYHEVSLEKINVLLSEDEYHNHVFQAYVERIFLQYPAKNPHDQEKTIQQLIWLARHMLGHGQSVFLIERIQASWLSIDQRRIYYRVLWTTITFVFAAISGLVAYVAVPFIMDVPAWIGGICFAIAGAIYGAMFASNYLWKTLLGTAVVGIGFTMSIFTGMLLSNIAVPLSLFLSVGVGCGVAVVHRIGTMQMKKMGFNGGSFVTLEAMKWSLHNLNWFTVIGGFVAGCVAIVVTHFALSPGSTNIANLIVATLVGGSFMLLYIAYLDGLSFEEIQQRTMPNQGIRRSLFIANQFALLNSIANILFFIIALSSVIPLILSMSIGSISLALFAVGGWTLYGGLPVVQHISMRLVLYWKGHIPWNYSKFLDACVNRILLRRVGGGYIFMHRSLLEFFASLPKSDDAKH